MKKIMFNDKYGLTQAVLGGRKTMTRRIIPDGLLTDAMTYACGDTAKRDKYLLAHAPYKVGDVIAVAQDYKTAYEAIGGIYGHTKANVWWRELHNRLQCDPHDTFGYRNKMYVCADCMPYRIRVTGLKLEHIAKISDEDCRMEGIVRVNWRQYPDSGSDRYVDRDVWTLPIYDDDGQLSNDDGSWAGNTAHTAFGALIIQMMGRKTWESNPLVFVYKFELET